MIRRSGITLVELLVVIAILVILIGLLLPALGSVRPLTRQLKCSINIRSIHQGMVAFSQSHKDSYPIPSALDRANVMTDPAGFKDQTRSIISFMIFQSFITPKTCVTPAEANVNIVPDEDYQYAEPSGIADPAKSKLALWDPWFRASPADSTPRGSSEGPTPTKGNFSYAHTPPMGAKKAYWSSNYPAKAVVLGNRGPWYTLVGGASGDWRLADRFPPSGSVGEIGSILNDAMQSKTLLIHGRRSTWEGNLGFNDNHVSYVSQPDPESLPFSFTGLAAASRPKFDNVFVNEHDISRDPGPNDTSDFGATAPAQRQTNQYIRMWASGSITAAGVLQSYKWFAD